MRNLLKYPRQFVVSTTPTQNLSHFKYHEIGQFHVYHCPTLATNIAEKPSENSFVILFGYTYKSDNVKISENEILSGILEKNSLKEISSYVEGLSGRFALFVFHKGAGYVFNDPTGLRTVYFLRNGKRNIFGTQPLLLGEFVPLESGVRSELFFHSQYFSNADEYWLPAGLSLYDNVEQLIPNHYLDLNVGTQKRFWPVIQNTVNGEEKTINDLVLELKQSMETAISRFELALPLTSGLDSRLLLSFLKKVKANVLYFTRIHKTHLNHGHSDIIIPKKILESLGVEHHLILADKEVSISEEEWYKSNNSSSRFKDGVNLFSSKSYLLSEKYVLYGNLSEVVKIRKRDKTYTELEHFDILPTEWLYISFIKEYMDEWLEDAKRIERDFNINCYELFYLEHRMGNWAARAYNENDLLFEVFTPFNSRSILMKLLSIDINKRSLPEAWLHRRIICSFWPEIDVFPYNPRGWNLRLLSAFKRGLRLIGISYIVRVFNDFLKQN